MAARFAGLPWIEHASTLHFRCVALHRLAARAPHACVVSLREADFAHRFPVTLQRDDVSRYRDDVSRHRHWGIRYRDDVSRYRDDVT